MAYEALRLFADGDILRAEDVNRMRENLRVSGGGRAMSEHDMIVAVASDDVGVIPYPSNPAGHYFRARPNSPAWEAP